MKADFTKVATTLTGEEVTQPKDPKDPNGEQIGVVLKDVVAASLLAPSAQESTPTPKEILAKYTLANKVTNAKGAITITKEQASLIEIAVCKNYTPLLAGQICKMLE